MSLSDFYNDMVLWPIFYFQFQQYLWFYLCFFFCSWNIVCQLSRLTFLRLRIIKCTSAWKKLRRNLFVLNWMTEWTSFLYSIFSSFSSSPLDRCGCCAVFLRNMLAALHNRQLRPEGFSLFPRCIFNPYDPVCLLPRIFC